MLHPERSFDPENKTVAIELYNGVKDLPLICPHGHVDPGLFSNPDFHWQSPVDLLIIPDHYVFRMLYSQGISLSELGIGHDAEEDHLKIWQTFADHFYLFRGTPTGLWLQHEFEAVFGVTQKLTRDTAQEIYDQIADRLVDLNPRELFKQFNIEVLCTTDAATDELEHHRVISETWDEDIRPTFRPDSLLTVDHPDWHQNLARLGELSGQEITNYRVFIDSLEDRRAFFKTMGAIATDHSAPTAYTNRLTEAQAGAIFERALRHEVSEHDAVQFMGHMLMEMARMSAEDGLVMQLHCGVYRNHNGLLFEKYGRDMGADIPLQAEFVQNLRPLLNEVGAHSNFTLILFTLDETTYSRELAPLAGHYPAVKLGPPWWFFDSLNGMRRYFDRVVETAGIYNLAGFNDDTRAFPSIPARHDVWRRSSANWLAGHVHRHIIDMDDARDMAYQLAYGLAKGAYKL